MLLHESAASMEQSVPENLSTHVYNECEVPSCRDSPAKKLTPSPPPAPVPASTSTPASTTKVKLSFSVDRLLGADTSGIRNPSASSVKSCCDGNIFSCCSYPHCFSQSGADATKMGYVPIPAPVQTPATHPFPYAGLDKLYPSLYPDYKSVMRPLPIRPTDHVSPTYPALATNALLRFHQHQQHKPPLSPSAPPPGAAMLAPLHHSLKSLQQQRFLGKTQQQLDSISASAGAGTLQNLSTSNQANGGGGNSSSSSNNNGKRKRSWSRAVFTNLQRKGLEIQFQQQKYITKPDRRKLAARLNLTDAQVREETGFPTTKILTFHIFSFQVKVWFQNRRMKWRHTRENLKSGQEKQPHQQSIPAPVGTGSNETGSKPSATAQDVLDFSSDSCSSVDLSEEADDDDTMEIDVVE
ncbi:hypothetical protein KR074_011189 [Drosophila pseudoananassae]|nr:hypothetical protein KR074_011189 [Drosophila pseudoananassae]